DYGTGVLEGGKGVKRKKGRIAEVSGSNAATTIGKNRENMATVEVTASGTGPFSSLSKPFHFLNTTGNSSGGSYDVVNDDPNTGTIPININDSPTLDPNNYGPIHSEPTLYAKVTGEPSRKSFSSMDGLVSMLENDMWSIRNNSLIMKKWNLNVNLLKKDVGNISVWVKLHGVLVTAFSDDGLSSIATKLGTPLMLDSYTYDMCMQSWGRSSYARAMIELRADVELKDIIVVVMSKRVGGGVLYVLLLWGGGKNTQIVGSDVAKNLKSPSQDPKGIPVGPKVGFKPVKQVYIHVSKKNNANTSGKTKKDVESAKEVSYPNLFDVLNSVEIDVDMDTNEGTSNLASKEANSGMWDLVPPKHFGCGFFLWKEIRLRELMSSLGAPSTSSYSAGHSTHPSNTSGPSTPPTYSSGPSTPTNYSLGSSRNRECSNCKHLRGKISVLKATMEMHMHPEQHTVNSAALFHEVLNEMEKLDLE
ncbi:reverse transcriptase domain-containing protein, partial [Tanacetum coccineum]